MSSLDLRAESFIKWCLYTHHLPPSTFSVQQPFPAKTHITCVSSVSAPIQHTLDRQAGTTAQHWVADNESPG